MAATISASEAVLPSGIVAGAFGNAHSAWAAKDDPSDTIASMQSVTRVFIVPFPSCCRYSDPAPDVPEPLGGCIGEMGGDLRRARPAVSHNCGSLSGTAECVAKSG